MGRSLGRSSPRRRPQIRPRTSGTVTHGGDELPPELCTDEERRGWLARELAAERDREPGHEFDGEQIVARVQGSGGWLLEAKRQLEGDRWQTAGQVPRSRSERLWDAGRRLGGRSRRRSAWQRCLQAYRARGKMKDGRR